MSSPRRARERAACANKRSHRPAPPPPRARSKFRSSRPFSPRDSAAVQVDVVIGQRLRGEKSMGGSLVRHWRAFASVSVLALLTACVTPPTPEELELQAWSVATKQDTPQSYAD